MSYMRIYQCNTGEDNQLHLKLAVGLTGTGEPCLVATDTLVYSFSLIVNGLVTPSNYVSFNSTTKELTLQCTNWYQNVIVLTTLQFV